MDLNVQTIIDSKWTNELQSILNQKQDEYSVLCLNHRLLENNAVKSSKTLLESNKKVQELNKLISTQRLDHLNHVSKLSDSNLLIKEYNSSILSIKEILETKSRFNSSIHGKASFLSTKNK